MGLCFLLQYQVSLLYKFRPERILNNFEKNLEGYELTKLTGGKHAGSCRDHLFNFKKEKEKKKSKNVFYFGIGALICTRQEIQCPGKSLEQPRWG